MKVNINSGRISKRQTAHRRSSLQRPEPLELLLTFIIASPPSKRPDLTSVYGLWEQEIAVNCTHRLWYGKEDPGG